MKVSKGDFVINWSDEENDINIGKVMDDPNSDGEYDLEFFDGGSVSPAGDRSVVVPESIAKFLDKAVSLLPIDPSDGMHRLPEDIEEVENEA